MQSVLGMSLSDSRVNWNSCQLLVHLHPPSLHVPAFPFQVIVQPGLLRPPGKKCIHRQSGEVPNLEDLWWPIVVRDLVIEIELQVVYEFQIHMNAVLCVMPSKEEEVGVVERGEQLAS